MMIDRRQFSIVFIAFRLFLSCYASISTELVEEWGCYDSEFKLTCNDIDSHVGILEATFTPHCESNQNCLVYDEDSIMKIIAQSLSRKAETHEEEAAARKLLDAIRNAKLREREREENEVKTSEFRSELPITTSSTDLYDASTINEEVENITGEYESLLGRVGDKRMLRDSLEKLINLYLTKLREDSDEYSFYEDASHDRRKRDLHMTNRGLVKVNRRKKLVPGNCKIMRRRIGTLDRIEIQKALRNFTNTEFNIRKFLNYRCSGKNHCSFIFSSDHPYGIFWDEGTVHIKYICMDNFRVNKYCGELLQIGNEDWDLRSNINWQEIAKSNHHDDVEHIEDGSGEGMFNGPRTEALRQNAMNYYKVTNLKIIKADDDKNETVATAMPQGRKSYEIKKSDGARNKTKSKIFSQDFRILKILPNVVEKPEPDMIEKLKKEEHIFHHQKNEDELITSSGNGIESNEVDSTLKSPTTYEKVITSGIITPTIEIFTTDNDQKLTTTEEMMIKEIKDFEKTVSTTMLANDSSYEDLISNEVEPATLDSPARTNYSLDDDTDIDNDKKLNDTSDEYGDYGSTEVDEKSKKKKFGNHTSHQHTLPSSTLLHGFIANPGYPSYYIGNDKQCKWRIKMAKGQKMMLTILDLHLRIDEFCKDSLEIIDTDSKRSLWRGCSELTRLVQVQSLSHQIEIVLKTKSKNIFPKRGFLIHYKAIGCIDPELPANVKLVSRQENLLKFVCEPDHVFPDTTHNERALLCNNESWNQTLIQCVAIQETLGRQINLVNEKYRAGKMTSDSDMSDLLVPICIIAGLFVLNAIIFVVILRYRKQRREESLDLDRELADL